MSPPDLTPVRRAELCAAAVVAQNMGRLLEVEPADFLLLSDELERLQRENEAAVGELDRWTRATEVARSEARAARADHDAIDAYACAVIRAFVECRVDIDEHPAFGNLVDALDELHDSGDDGWWMAKREKDRETFRRAVAIDAAEPMAAVRGEIDRITAEAQSLQKQLADKEAEVRELRRCKCPIGVPSGTHIAACPWADHEAHRKMLARILDHEEETPWETLLTLARDWRRLSLETHTMLMTSLNLGNVSPREATTQAREKLRGGFNGATLLRVAAQAREMAAEHPTHAENTLEELAARLEAEAAGVARKPNRCT